MGRPEHILSAAQILQCQRQKNRSATARLTNRTQHMYDDVDD